jgi:dynein heavy chain
MSEDIKEQTIAAQQTEIEINKAREVYRRVSAEGAMLYFLIIALYVVNHMYQYSLESFTSFFLKAIDKTPQYEEIEQRVLHLRENIRMTIYQWVSRGLFEKHKQLFLMQITLRLMQKGVIDTAYDSQMVSFLLKCPLKPGVEKPQSLDWLPDNAWSAVQKLIEIEEFQSFATNMEKDAPTRFKEWFNELAPEHMKLPLDWKRLDNTPFQKLLVLRCLRPDRLTTAISDWIRDALPNGKSYVDMDQGLSFMDILTNVLDDATNTTPIFFILSPGTDPVADVERIGKRKHIEEGKNYWNVAMGQGTEDTAMRGLENGHKEGHWVMLQNIHLMPKWLNLLEKKLDMFASEGSNMNFRLFLSAEPSKEIPISILDRSIKLTNEPPQGMKANLKRAFAHFNREEFNEKDPRVKAIMFGLCFFHATVLERRKFGPKGWNMHYPFSMGDLRDSSLVLMNYLENAQGSSKIPWDDLRYIFGEIMYGGHIVDDLDRKLCNTYLQILMDNPLLDETELFPFSDGKSASFRSPPPNEYHKYVEYIDEYFPPETPLAFDMHPNAEIGFRTAQCQFLFNTLLELQPRDEAAAEEGASRSKNEIAQEIVTHILEDMGLENLKFDLDDIKGKIPEEDEKMCFINVFLQECEYMNILLIEMIRSLHEIQLALNGELTPTEQMEATIDSLVMERVPVKWVELAYPSCRSLSSWLVNLQSRVEQLSGWKDEPVNIPKVTNISRLFNPQSFLTAVKQYHAQRTKSELNKLFIQTDITKRWENEIDGPLEKVLM